MDVKKRAFILAFLGIIFSVLEYLLLILSRRYNLVIFLAGLFTSDIVALLKIGATICFCLFLHMTLKYLGARYLKFTVITRVSSFLVTSISVLLCLILILFLNIDESGRIVIESHNEEHTIIVTEGYSWHHGGGTFYEKLNPLFVIPIGSYSMGNVERPFTNGEYTVVCLRKID